VGYTVYHERLTIEQFVKEADEAMYHSKQNGKNQVTAYRNIRRDHKISTGS
ncbi:diguanylate cyclase, partial [Clostridium perfringens]|nr:diguanylate cyclase [Clostridium perfringens]